MVLRYHGALSGVIYSHHLVLLKGMVLSFSFLYIHVSPNIVGTVFTLVIHGLPLIQLLYFSNYLK